MCEHTSHGDTYASLSVYTDLLSHCLLLLPCLLLLRRVRSRIEHESVDDENNEGQHGGRTYTRQTTERRESEQHHSSALTHSDSLCTSSERASERSHSVALEQRDADCQLFRHARWTLTSYKTSKNNVCRAELME